MEDDDDDAKLKEEIEAELDKISISSLEKDEVESDSKSETQSDDSDAVNELPESVLHCINIIKNKSKTAEELILQDLEDSDVLSCSYGEVCNNHIYLRIGLSTAGKEDSEQLMKILSEIEKEEFMRSQTRCANPDCITGPHPCELHMEEHVLPGEEAISFGYCEVEERCRQSFEAWQNKQKELEDKEKETLKAQRDKEKKQFQEEEEKRNCWMKKFEVEKKKLEDIQKQEQDKMNDELHKEEEMWKKKFKQHEEHIRNLHLQMEEERIKFNDLQEKEKHRLSKLQHDAAVKIQAKYKAFKTYQKYSLIIREQIENKKRKAQQWKEMEAKIRQKDEERRKRLEEKQRLEEEIKKQRQEERKKREKEYEEKKNILRQEREELRNKEKLRLREDAGQLLIIRSALKKDEYNVKNLVVTDMSKNKSGIAKVSVDVNSKKQEDVPFGLVGESSKRENVDRQLILKELNQIQSTSNQSILAESKRKKSENLAQKQCSQKLVKREINCENVNQKDELENSDLKDNVIVQFQLQKLKSQTQDGESVEQAINENMEEDIQIMLGQNQEIEMKNSKAQKAIKDNQQKIVQRVEEEEISEQNEPLYEEDNTSIFSIKQNLLSLKLEDSGGMPGNVKLHDKEMDFKFKEIEENAKVSAENSDIVIFNITDAAVDTEGKVNNCVLGSSAACEDLSGDNEESSLVKKKVNSLESEMKEIPEECHGTRNESESITIHSTPELPFLSSVEEKRLVWIKSFKSWFEVFKQNQQDKVIKRKRPVKCPNNVMSPLNTLEILQGGPWNTLQQVTSVTFQDLPGCNLSTLAECINLKFLSLRRCGLNSLHNLSNCKKIKYIDAQENHIETINCENLENLCVVLLNNNQLTSLHGLDGCTNIQNLELSHNKITRIGGLESLKNLQQLIMDHNQLISTKGLHDTPTIIHLDCSYNHLTAIEGIENCGLLQILKLQGNYLSELPSLENHVLLRELHLDDNSISTVEEFSSYWLPLLQNLTICQNSLTKIVPLFHFVSLEKLDVSNNCLSDLTSAKKWFGDCYSLRDLSLTGNPLLQEINWRCSLLKMLPSLRVLNGDILPPGSEIHTKEHHHLESGCFLVLCQHQIQEFTLLNANYKTGKGDIFTLDASENLCHYFNKLMTLSKEFRYAHEHWAVNVTKRDESEAEQNHLSPPDSARTLQNGVPHSCASEHKADVPDIVETLVDFDSSHSALSYSCICEDLEGRNQERIGGQKREDSKTSSISTKRIPLMETMMANCLLSNHQNTEQNEKIMAAVVIQSHWRGYAVRRKINFSTKTHTAATEPQPDSFMNNQTILKKEKRGIIMTIQEQREKAAVIIQAVWKGFILRKKLTTALEAIKYEESEEEYEEIDLEDFTFDEAALEKEWLALDSTRFPSQTLLLSNQLHWPKNSGSLKYDDTSLNLPSCPAQAWLCNEKENLFSLKHTQLNSRSENRTLSWTPESKTSRNSLLKSEKEEKISEEWGFKDISTAQQMLKRAKKMKSKKLKKKLGKEEDFIYKDSTANEKFETRKEYTYQWLHTQVGIHEKTSSRNMKCNHFLPELDPDVLNGGRVQLVARLVSREDTDLDLFSMTSGSALSVKKEKKSQAHRHSAGSSSKLWFPSELI
uniref:Leucine-rich repeat and IQ domain-containing protein 1 n=1 Tax=Castor canadensis TaxID=51338 RepID=A0A8C0W778_CASCN